MYVCMHIKRTATNAIARRQRVLIVDVAATVAAGDFVVIEIY